MEEKKEKFNKVEYDNRYIKENKDRINFVMPKGRKNDIKAYAQSAGISATEWINQAILEKMQFSPAIFSVDISQRILCMKLRLNVSQEIALSHRMSMALWWNTMRGIITERL